MGFHHYKVLVHKDLTTWYIDPSRKRARRRLNIVLKERRRGKSKKMRSQGRLNLV